MSFTTYLLLVFCMLLSYPPRTMISKLFRAIIMGPPGSGKGTIATRIIKDFDLKHLSSGDLLRAQIMSQTSLGVQAKKHIEAGQLVPDDVMVNLMVSELKKIDSHNWLLDGFPRTVTQAEKLVQKETIDSVINLDVPFEVIIDRIKGRWLHAGSGRTYHTEFNPPKKAGFDDETGEPLVQREDDKEETVKARLQNYQNQTQPVLEFFREKNLLTEFSGNYSNEIWPHVHKFLSVYIPAKQYTEYK